MIGRKTAALIAASIEAGALLATDDEAVIRRYRAFGWALGIAFQLNDDLLGIWGDEQATGKEPSDLAQQKKTLPVIYALEHAGPEDRARLRELYATPRSDVGRGRRDRRDPGADRRPRVHPRHRRGATATRRSPSWMPRASSSRPRGRASRRSSSRRSAPDGSERRVDAGRLEHAAAAILLGSVTNRALDGHRAVKRAPASAFEPC